MQKTNNYLLLFSHPIFLYSDGTAKRYYHKLLCIALLPADRIRMTFAQLKSQIEVYQELKGFPGAFDRYLNYFQRQWIDGHVSDFYEKSLSRRQILYMNVKCIAYA